MSISLTSQSKVLIIRFSSIGDIVLCTPIIRTLKKQIGCEVHFLQKERFKEVLSANPYIDKHYYLEQNDLKISLQSEKYDLLIDLHKNVRTSKFKFWLSVPSLTFHKANIEKWKLVNFTSYTSSIRHLVDRYFDAVKSLGIENDGEGLDFFISLSDSTKAMPKHYIALMIGAAHYTKQIPQKLCKEIIEASDSDFILLGGKNEIAKSKSLESLKGIRKNFVGKLSLQESAQVVLNSEVVITGDTGMMHIAAALQKPIVSIWGSTAPSIGMYPYYGNSATNSFRIEHKELSCRPCTKIGKSTCPKGHFKCMADLSAKDIISKTNELLLRN